MTLGRVYVWERDENEFTGGRLRLEILPLDHLSKISSSKAALSGRFVDVVNGGRTIEDDGGDGAPSSSGIGSASPDPEGNFLWDPAAGGGRRKKTGSGAFRDQAAWVSACHFGEVNSYHHITRMAERIDALLSRLGEKPLPKVRVVANAFKQAAGPVDGREGIRDADGTLWEPLRSSRYRRGPSAGPADGAAASVHCAGEILLAPGASMTREGWLPRLAGTRYRCNVAHIAGHLYRQYAFHVSRYTADFMANALVNPAQETAGKSVTASAISDYWAASMLRTPHIWCWHRRHDSNEIHPRSLASTATMADLQSSQRPSQRETATVLAAALWDLRARLADGALDDCDLLVLSALLSVRSLVDDRYRPDPEKTRKLRDGFPVFAACLLYADRTRFGGRYEAQIRQSLGDRGIEACKKTLKRLERPSVPEDSVERISQAELERHSEKIRSRFAEAIVPEDSDLLDPDRLEAELRVRGGAHHYDLAVAGDVMTGMRMRHRIRRFGPDYVCAWVKPIFDRTSIPLGNLEGPFAAEAEQQDTTRNFSYKVDPRTAVVLRRSGFQAMTIANNHIMDCGRDGVRETLTALSEQGIVVIGGGPDEARAHNPAIFETRGGRIGLLGYYWNRRTSARGGLPGSARDLPELVERDIGRLKEQVDRVAVTVHWGVPYDREPQPEDRVKARHFIDCGADIVVGHHPHIIQPLEVYRGRPIFYSVGNFAFGSGNSRAESLLVCARFKGEQMLVEVFPIYVQNRDPRLNYQPKVLRGEAAARTLSRLASISGTDGEQLEIGDFSATLQLTLTPAPMRALQL